MKDHGTWSVRDEIDPTLIGLPEGVMVIMRVGDNAEWYSYQKTIGEDTVKCTIFDGKVLMANVDTSRVFPAGAKLLELDDTTGDPKDYIGRDEASL